MFQKEKYSRKIFAYNLGICAKSFTTEGFISWNFVKVDTLSRYIFSIISDFYCCQMRFSLSIKKNMPFL